MNIWQVLGIAATRDASEVRRAYARRLKTIDQRTEQEAFQTLRAAYERALALAAQAATAEHARDASHPAPAKTPVAEPVAEPRQAPTRPSATSEPRPAPDSEPTAEEPRRERVASRPRAEAETRPVPDPEPAAEEQAPPPAAEPDPRERDWARAEELVRLLGETLSSKGGAGAVEAFQAMLASEELHSLNLRDAFEWRLLFALANTRQLPLALTSAAVDFFDWGNRPDLLASAAGPALQNVLRRRAAQQRYEELRELASMHSYSAHFSGKAIARKAARSLLATHSPWRFRWRAMSIPLLAEVRNLLADIDARAPDMPDAFLDPQTVAFWRDAVAHPPPSFRWLALGFMVGLIASVFAAVDRTGPAALGVMAVVVVATVAAFYGAAVVHRRWLRGWQRRLHVGSAIALERTIGRVFPGAVHAGLGWKHVLMTLVFAPFVGITFAGFALFPGLERLAGRLYPFLLMLLAGVVIALLFAAWFQLKHWLGPRSETAQRRWRIGWLTLLWFLALGAAGAGQPTLLVILLITTLVRYAGARKGG